MDTNYIINVLDAEFGEEFRAMLAELQMQHIDTETAVFICYNKLKCK